MLVFLVGYMGSGKTTAGEILARRLGYHFMDLDRQIEEEAGTSISALFEEQGEKVFREWETKTIRSFAALSNYVIATGGGLPCHSDNMDWMLENGIVVYLEANSGLLYQRLVNARKDRPLLDKMSKEELREFIERHLNSRTAVYSRATLCIPAADLNVNELAARVRLELDKKSS